MRILALDVGEKRIGVAISDELGLTAQALDVIERENNGKDIDKIRKIIFEHNIKKVIVGLPKNLNGTLGTSGKAVKQYVEKLQHVPGIQLEFWDERLSTVAAEKALLKADVSRKKRKAVIDKIAAAIILQNYLDFISKSLR